MDTAEIRAHATGFRDAIERCDRAALGISFTHFPRGSCGDVAPLLGTYLKDVGAGAFQYVLGARGEGRFRETHAWLEGDRLIIDITADQFDDAPRERVIVTTRSPWHNSFEREAKHDGDYRAFDPMTQAELGRIYEIITACLRQAT